MVAKFFDYTTITKALKPYVRQVLGVKDDTHWLAQGTATKVQYPLATFWYLNPHLKNSTGRESDFEAVLSVTIWSNKMSECLSWAEALRQVLLDEPTRYAISQQGINLLDIDDAQNRTVGLDGSQNEFGSGFNITFQIPNIYESTSPEMSNISADSTIKKQGDNE